MTDNLVRLDGEPLTPEAVEAVARHGARVRLEPAAAEAVGRAAATVARHAGGDRAVYGVNTGFGSLGSVRIDPDQVRQVQRNLVRSHAAGVGDPLPDDAVRAMLVILAASLARGRSGVRVEVIERIADLLDHGITPEVPSRGSVGASGDLAPLAHAALVLIGEGRARTAAGPGDGGAALAAAGLAPVVLDAKEGLALVNGTHLMAAMASLALRDAERVADAALDAAALAIDACRATDAFLDPRLHAARGHAGQVRVAAALRERLEGTQIVPSHHDEDPRVQDPYCLRAAPQVMGAALDTLAHVRAVVERELGAVTDNPLVLDDDVVSGGNFHGMPLAIALDLMPLALAHLAGIAERRVNWLLTASDHENPVNPHLSPQPGLQSGLMIAQYTAAACCNELQTLATPASVGNIPTSAGMEDYNSMGMTAAHQARAAVDLAVHVVSIELLVMAEALEYQRPLRSGPGVERVHDLVRTVVPRLTEDRSPAPDIAAIGRLVRDGAFCSPAS
ncbi:MAG: histidine ammonia-lyase [Planctomycetota bacterium]|jgi:histidine ammonia-lyase